MDRIKAGYVDALYQFTAAMADLEAAVGTQLN